MRGFVGVFLTFLIFSCIGFEHDKVDSMSPYHPLLAIPLCDFFFQYDSISDLPAEVLMDAGAFSFEDADSIEINLGYSISSSEQITAMSCRLDVHNQFPFPAQLFLFYVDNNGVNFPLNKAGIPIPAAEIDPVGELLSYTPVDTDISFTKEQLDGIYSSKYLVFKAVVFDVKMTPEHVSHLGDYSLAVHVGLMVQTAF